MALKRVHKKSKPSKLRMVILTVTAIILATGLFASITIYNWALSPNVFTKNNQPHYLYLPEKVTFSEAIALIEREHILRNTNSLVRIAKLMGYDSNIKPGRYKVNNGMSNYRLLKLLRSGHQEPVNVTFHEIRTLERLAEVVSKKIVADSSEIIHLLKDQSRMAELGFTPQTSIALFIPNTYQFYWTTNAEQFVQRMKHEYDRYWDKLKVQKAKEQGLTPIEVSILASIVDEETAKNDEKANIAGLYLNRLHKGMPLQADPTVKFALGNFSINRILTADLKIDSPYNTYRYAGLPPGPIRMASIAGIEAVLSPVKHNYYYMCAKEDFSGYHNFAQTLEQHNRNAAKYRKALRQRNIWR